MSFPRPDQVSIHAPARGATKPRGWRGGVRGVSIHAPARGATRSGEAAARRCSCFNPRPRTGGDFPLPAEVTALTRFQSTPPHGGRPITDEGAEAMMLLFQSTPPHGGRHEVHVVPDLARHVSIHAPARGATRPHHERAGLDGVSIHAPARGATRQSPALSPDEAVSIHAPARGATHRRRSRWR